MTELFGGIRPLLFMPAIVAATMLHTYMRCGVIYTICINFTPPNVRRGLCAASGEQMVEKNAAR